MGAQPAQVLALVGLDQEQGGAVAQALAPAWDVLRVASTSREDLRGAGARRPHVGLVQARGALHLGQVVADVLVMQPDAAVLVTTGEPDDDELFAALRAGAAGYLPSPLPLDRLPEVLRAALAGEVVLPRPVVTRLARAFRRRPTSTMASAEGRPVELTGRETEVLHLLGTGLSTRQVAERLHVQPVTVRACVSGLCRKLRVPDRAGLLALHSAQE